MGFSKYMVQEARCNKRDVRDECHWRSHHDSGFSAIIAVWAKEDSHQYFFCYGFIERMVSSGEHLFRIGINDH